MNNLAFNNAKRICREVMVRIAQGVLADNLTETIDRIPYQMRPQSKDATRCCIYKDRAVIKYRCMAALGMPIENEVDEMTSLAEYTRQAFEGSFLHQQQLTVLDVACSSCKKSHYHITNACMGCAARPCTLVCHKKAIQIENGQAKINMDNCVNCGKCMKECPYHAIVRVPIPCQEACPVNAIGDTDNGQKAIDPEKCILCGRCLTACPFGAIMECSQMIHVLKALKGTGHVTALAAPAMAGQFPASWKQMEKALIKIGFDRVIPVAYGADMTIQHEAMELEEKLEEGQAFMTTSCCPAYVQVVEKHIPELGGYVSHTPSPMQYAAMMARDENPETMTVFIGPCVAKKAEALTSEIVDYVMTFEELGAVFIASEMLPDDCDESDDNPQEPSMNAKRFPISGCVGKAVMESYQGQAEVKPVYMENLDKKNLVLLKQFAKGKCPGNFVEVMACSNGCVGGPCAVQAPATAKKRIENDNLNG